LLGDDDSDDDEPVNWHFANDELDAINHLKLLTKKCRSICSKFNHSQVLNDRLLEEQKENPLHLVQEVVTRWNATLNMIERIVKLKLPLNNVLRETDNRQNNHRNLIISEIEENELKDLVDLLTPFNDITKKLSGENYTTASFVIPCVRSLQISMDEMLNDDMNFKFKINIASVLKKSIDYYVNDYGFFKDEFLIAMTYLDPR